ncbi:TRAM domain-containing protein [Halorubrum californiense DSM 19288]|uniref:TRAM domain-containing protein n=1 Tax=Halorubrum californiense DSM 19288 TaxID=1227465 RepID=M0DZ24_9EURY|nr:MULTISPECIES: TRAM domain-containing protein [Halorubrum]ELZ40756.1 TRAM domain-containing protein [Halorubrum californiense DSM 19288]TKX72947.1 TRAM domain-containing protein [Halorubrum sp. GN11GM_10-3_MGM]
MIEISDSLRSVFSAQIEERDGSYIVDVPVSEIEHDALAADETYRVAILASASSTSQETQEEQSQSTAQEPTPTSDGPPVDEGEVRDVTIETTGDQGDGIAKVERGYVVIVPGGQPGDEPSVEIEQVQANVAFASIVDPDSRAL